MGWADFAVAVGSILGALAVLWIYPATGYGDDFVAFLETRCGNALENQARIRLSPLKKFKNMFKKEARAPESAYVCTAGAASTTSYNRATSTALVRPRRTPWRKETKSSGSRPRARRSTRRSSRWKKTFGPPSTGLM